MSVDKCYYATLLFVFLFAIILEFSFVLNSPASNMVLKYGNILTKQHVERYPAKHAMNTPVIETVFPTPAVEDSETAVIESESMMIVSTPSPEPTATMTPTPSFRSEKAPVVEEMFSTPRPKSTRELILESDRVCAKRSEF